MSRAGSKAFSKEKSKQSPVQNAPAAAEVVPGKLSESDWIAMVEKDSGEDFILDIIDEILASTSDAIYQLYLGKQLLPYTMMHAKREILYIIEWQFLARDDREDDTREIAWVPDEEPAPAATDCWAQGAVPKTEVPPSSFTTKEDMDLSMTGSGIEKEEESTEPGEMVEISDVLEDREETEVEVDEAAVTPATSETRKKRKAKKQRSVKTKTSDGSGLLMPSNKTDAKNQLMVEATDHRSSDAAIFFGKKTSCQSMAKPYSVCTPEIKSGELAEQGNVPVFVKWDAENLPTHLITTRYHIVDPIKEEEQPQQGRKGRARQVLDKSVKIEQAALNSGYTMPKRKASILTAIPPALLDNIDVAPGVLIIENGRTKRGPAVVKQKDTFEKHQYSLLPLTSTNRSRNFSISDLLDFNSPIVRRMSESRPLPPISAKQTNDTDMQ